MPLWIYTAGMHMGGGAPAAPPTSYGGAGWEAYIRRKREEDERQRAKTETKPKSPERRRQLKSLRLKKPARAGRLHLDTLSAQASLGSVSFRVTRWGRLELDPLHAEAMLGLVHFKPMRAGKIELATLSARAALYDPFQMLRAAEEAVLLSGGDITRGLLLVSELSRAGALR